MIDQSRPLLTCEQAMELANSIMTDLNLLQEENPDSLEYLTGIRDVIGQILKLMDKTNRATERQITLLKNLKQTTSKWVH